MDTKSPGDRTQATINMINTSRKTYTFKITRQIRVSGYMKPLFGMLRIWARLSRTAGTNYDITKIIYLKLLKIKLETLVFNLHLWHFGVHGLLPSVYPSVVRPVILRPEEPAPDPVIGLPSPGALENLLGVSRTVSSVAVTGEPGDRRAWCWIQPQHIRGLLIKHLILLLFRGLIHFHRLL